MPNDFEKQVRQKMEELDLVPGEPVWAKVEAQIRRKKDRRRMMFWLPLFLLMTGGIALWLNEASENKKPEQTANKIAPVLNTSAGQEKTVQNSFSKPTVVTNQNKRKNDIETNNDNSNAGNPVPTRHLSSNNLANVVTPEIQTIYAKKPVDKMVTNSGDQSATNIPGTIGNNADESKVEAKQAINKKNSTATILIPMEKTEPANKSTEVNKIKTELNAQEKNDTVAVNKPDSAKAIVLEPKKKQPSHWKIAAIGFGGSSGLADGLTVLSSEKSMDAYAVPGSLTSSPTYAAASYTPASVKNGFSFSLGAAAIKDLSKKFSLSLGLEYHYISNKMLVGQDSAGYVRVNNQNNMVMAGSRVKYNYTNQYHFVSLPVDVAFRPLKKLDIAAGISLQQLITTNGLVYKNQYKAYTNDKDAFTKTQFFSRLGMNYSFAINQHNLVVGPQVNYGLSKLVKNETDKHLFSFGLRTAFVF